MNLLVDLFTVNADVFGRSDAYSHLFASNFKDHNFDLVTYHDALTDFSGEHQHSISPSMAGGRV